MKAPVPASWREYQRRNRVAIWSFIAGLLGVFTIGVLLGALNIPGTVWVLPAAFLGWCFLWGRAAFRVVRWPCPRCGAPWLSSQPPEFSRHRKCGKCGLGLYEAT